MQDIQNIPNPDVNSNDNEPVPHRQDIEQPDDSIPVPPDSEPQVPIQEPPDVERQAPIEEDDTGPKKIV